MSERPKCLICGEPIPEGEEMFKIHGFSGDCPSPPLPTSGTPRTDAEYTYVVHGITYVSIHFAHQLERENQQLREEIERLSKEKT